jgi:hypothetical protein
MGDASAPGRRFHLHCGSTWSSTATGKPRKVPAEIEGPILADLDPEKKVRSCSLSQVVFRGEIWSIFKDISLVCGVMFNSAFPLLSSLLSSRNRSSDLEINTGTSVGKANNVSYYHHWQRD